MSRLSENLPEQCWIVIPSAPPGERIGLCVRLKRGYGVTQVDKPEFSASEVRDLVREMNDEQGVTENQQALMTQGSLIGWHILVDSPTGSKQE